MMTEFYAVFLRRSCFYWDGGYFCVLSTWADDAFRRAEFGNVTV